MSDEIITMNIRIEGAVQGMGFRDFAVREANTRGLKGWVRKEVYGRADLKLSLSYMTFSHQMVRLLFLEQLYRVLTVIKGDPYHHE